MALDDDLRNLLDSYTEPCIGDCDHSQCPVLRELHALRIKATLERAQQTVKPIVDHEKQGELVGNLMDMRLQAMSNTAPAVPKIRKVHLDLLERVFSAEIEDRLPAQIGQSKAVTWLHKNGYIEPMTVTLGGGLPVRIDGWNFTEKGRVAYCESCDCHSTED